jgi:hypothetical protein
MSWVKQQQVWKGERLGRTGFGVLVEEACIRSSSCERLQVSPVQSCLATRILHHAANGSHLSSPFSRPNQTKPNRSFSLRALSVCLSPTFVCTLFRRHSSAAVSTCIARCCGRPFSVTYLPGTPSACPREANSIRRPGFPPQSNHPIKALLPQITSLHFRDMAPDDPFQVLHDCRPFLQVQRFPRQSCS